MGGALAAAAVVVIPLFPMSYPRQQIVRRLVGVEDPGRPPYIAVLVLSLVVAVVEEPPGRYAERLGH